MKLIGVRTVEAYDLAGRHTDNISALAAEWEAYRLRVGLEEFELWNIQKIEGVIGQDVGRRLEVLEGHEHRARPGALGDHGLGRHRSPP